MSEVTANSDEVIYTARVRAVNGRGGFIESLTGSLKADLSRPATRGTDSGTDPEELFAAGYSACFDSALAVTARREHVKIGATTTTVSVSLRASTDATFSISVEIHVDAPECEPGELNRLVGIADTLCPYSNAIRGNVDVQVTTSGP
jgi:Ohr subfamily peroxiredoxin